MYFEMTPLGLIMVHIVCNLKSNSFKLFILAFPLHIVIETVFQLNLEWCQLTDIHPNKTFYASPYYLKPDRSIYIIPVLTF